MGSAFQVNHLDRDVRNTTRLGSTIRTKKKYVWYGVENEI